MNGNIVIIGMPGSGKTTVGSLVSKKLEMKFIDMDEYIARKENKSIPAMFAISEEYFRNAETECAKEVSKESSTVISTGGGVIKRKENMDYLKQNSVIVFLNRPIEKIIADIDTETRPLLKESISNIHMLYSERIYLYKKYCHIEILNNKTAGDAANSIAEAYIRQKKLLH
ncbi:MAG TPA: shikimate kinase [Clostridiales bacterium]|nr:shikimate kinase [Clostridiales bacterium]